MRLLTKLTPLAASAALVLSGCGGGGGGTAPHPVTPATTPASANSSHTVVGTARLTLALPHVVTAKGTTKVVRAIPHGAARASAKAVARTPKYINPSPNPGNGPCPGGENVLDIYVNGVLLPALDGLGEAPDSLCVAQTTDSTQLVTIPLYSVNASQIVAVEWDALFLNVLAIGETDYGYFSAGSAINVSLTMQMNAKFIGVTDLGFNDPVLMQGGSWSYLSGPCPGTSQFAVYPTDGLGTFVPIAGYGGTSTPTASGSSGGFTTLANSAIPGIYNVAWDSSCDALNLTASAPNPAYAIWFDAYEGYGSYPGIQYLYQYDINGFDNAFSQLDQSTAAGTLQVQNGG